MKIEQRVWLAPMGGEAACAPLVAAVAEAGGFGWLGGAYLAPARLAAVIGQIRALTARPFGLGEVALAVEGSGEVSTTPREVLIPDVEQAHDLG